MQTYYFTIPLFILFIFTAWFYVIVPSIQRGKEMASNQPVILKKGTLVLYQKKYFEVMASCNGKYNLRGIDKYKTLILNVDRSSIERAVN